MNLKNWFVGIRLYIALAILLITLQAWWWARVTYGGLSGSNVATIRLQEVYAWTSLGFLLFALLIGPALKVFPRLPGKMLLRDARRMIGIGAAWFALLHAVLSYDALFRWPNPATLAQVYQRSLALGLLALIVLLLMALTSFNAAMRRMGPWWFRLHRLVYVAALAALLHAFMVGTHTAQLGAVLVVAVSSAILLALYIAQLFRGEPPSSLQIITVTLLTVLLVAIINYDLTQYLGYNILLKGHAS